MKAILTGLALAVTVGATAELPPSGGSGNSDADRLGLGRQLATEVIPDKVSGAFSVDDALVELDLHGFDGKWVKDLSPRADVPDGVSMVADAGPLRHSLEAGVATIAPRLTDALGTVYARAFDADTLRSAVEFFGSSSEREAIARRADADHQLFSNGLSDDGRLSTQEIIARSDRMRGLFMQAEAVSTAEAAFAKTPAGLALGSRDKQTQKEIFAALQSLWPEAVAAAEADYCGAHPCDAGTHWSFHRLAVHFGPEIEPAGPGDAAASPVAAARPAYDRGSFSDRKLQQFDQTHPTCEMWTDWHKLCSRMGPGGATSCRTDPYYSATPSEPFCAQGEPMNNDTLPQALSRTRYCARSMDDLSPEQTEPKGAHYCVAYQRDRPFSGERIGQVETPDCLQWAGICATDGKGVGGGGMASCADPKVRQKRQTYVYACMRWSARVRCMHPIGGVEFEETVVDMLMDPPLTRYPVFGVYCQTDGD